MPFASLLRSSRNSLVSESPNREKNLENFSKFLGFFFFFFFFHSHNSFWRYVCEWKLQLRAYTEGFATHLRVDLPVVKKTYIKFSKFCLRDFGDLLTSQLIRKNHVFCTNRVKSQTILKTFLVFPCITCTHLVLSASPSPKTSIIFTKPPFSSSILHQFSRKGMRFLLFSMNFKFLALVFLDFMYVLRYGNMVVEYGYIDVLMSLIYGFC